MSYNTAITFVKAVGQKYNSKTSLMEGTFERRTIYGSVTDMGVDRSMQIFGNLDKRRLTIRLRAPYMKPFDYIEVRGVAYQPMTRRELLRWVNGVIVEEHELPKLNDPAKGG